MSSKRVVTISLVRLAIRSITISLKKLLERADHLLMEEMVEALKEYVDNALDVLEDYFLQSKDAYYDWFIFQIAEFLDPRVCFGVTSQLQEVERIIREEYCLDVERSLPASNGDDGVPAAWISSSESGRVSKIDSELKAYRQTVANMKKMERLDVDPLEFWASEYATRTLPILQRTAAKVLCVAPAESDVERMFSKGRRVSPWDRASLNAETINMLVSLGNWSEEGFWDDTGSSKGLYV
jgi:hAT family C-terminal dimerisation region